MRKTGHIVEPDHMRRTGHKVVRPKTAHSFYTKPTPVYYKDPYHESMMEASLRESFYPARHYEPVPEPQPVFDPRYTHEEY
jgi:hypothetical protein